MTDFCPLMSFSLLPSSADGRSKTSPRSNLKFRFDKMSHSSTAVSLVMPAWLAYFDKYSCNVCVFFVFQGCNFLKLNLLTWVNRISAAGWKRYKKVPPCFFHQLSHYLLVTVKSLNMWSCYWVKGSRLKDACCPAKLSSNWPLFSLFSLSVWVALWNGNNRLAQQRDGADWRSSKRNHNNNNHKITVEPFPKAKDI